MLASTSSVKTTGNPSTIAARSTNAAVANGAASRGTISLLERKVFALEAEVSQRKQTNDRMCRQLSELNDFVESTSIGLHWIGPDGIIQWANKADFESLGFTAEEFIGHHIAEFHVERNSIEDILARLTRGEQLQDYEAHLKCKDGSIRTVLIDSSVLWDAGKFIHTQCFTRDITAQKRVEKRVTIQYLVSRILAESESVREAGLEILQGIGTHFSWRLGAFWGLEESGARLCCTAFWQASDSIAPNFQAVTEQTAFARGVGLPGRTWASGHAEWVRDITQDGNFPRAAHALQDGLLSGFAFPIKIGVEAVGVIELFASEIRGVDRDFLELMSAIGNQFGQFIQRKRAEENLRKRGERLQLLSDTLAQLLGAREPGNLVRELFPKVAAHLGVDTYFNFMVNPAGNGLKLHSCAGISEETARAIGELPFGEAICGTVAQTRQLIHATDIQNTNYDKAHLVRGFGIQCYACNPLIVGDRLLGTLSFASRTRTAFDEEELQFLRIVSQYTAVALDRLQSAEQLRNSEEKYRSLFESIDQGFCTIEVLFDENENATDYRFLLVNPAFERQTGIPNAVGRRMREIAPMHEKHWFQRYGQIALTGESMRFESRAAELNRYYEVYAWRVGSPADRTLGVLFNDITERKKAEERERWLVNRTLTATAKFEAVFNQSGIFAGIMDLEGNVREINELALVACGYRREEVVDRPFWQTPWWRSSPAVQARIRAATTQAAAGSAFREVLPYWRADGTERVVEFAMHPIRDETGAVRLLHPTGIDITERRRTEQALRESEERFRTLADNMSQFAWMADEKGWIFWYNQRWYDYTGTTLEQMQGWGWKQVHHPDHLERVVASIQRSWDTGEVWDETFPLRGKQGEYRWFLSRAIPIRDTGGKIVRWFGTNTDVTELRETQARLAEACEHLSSRARELDDLIAERTAQLRDTVAELEAFSYSVAHDMRAPLRAMNSYARLLEVDFASRLPAEGKDFARRIARGAQRLDALITDVLDYSKVARGEMSLEKIDVEKLAHEIIDSYPQLQERSATILVQAPIPTVIGNTAALTQCISNLLSNAIKFVAPGTIPRVRIRGEKNAESVRLWFEDNGIGISAEGGRRIFSMFQRLNPATEFEGTGIGLTIVRKAVERMGGRIGVESQPGAGSQFWIELKHAP